MKSWSISSIWREEHVLSWQSIVRQYIHRGSSAFWGLTCIQLAYLATLRQQPEAMPRLGVIWPRSHQEILSTFFNSVGVFDAFWIPRATGKPRLTGRAGWLQKRRRRRLAAMCILCHWSGSQGSDVCWRFCLDKFCIVNVKQPRWIQVNLPS